MVQPTASETTTEAERELASKYLLLRRISIAEASSFLILLVAAVIKRAADAEFGVDLMGPIHGALFLIYTILLLRDHRPFGWSLWKMLAAIFLGAVPLGGFWVERRWLSNRP
ncbi:MAG: DUF3817 domain-containing protein [Actinomycetia bacterium]|nr:DUF3817 domain-containing protein [Actinomycetes bacterium]